MSEILRMIDEPATGFVGTIAVSGLPQREDHCLVVEAIAESLGCDISDISLSQGRTLGLKTLSPRHLSDTAATAVLLPFQYPYRTSLGKRKSLSSSGLVLKRMSPG